MNIHKEDTLEVRTRFLGAKECITTTNRLVKVINAHLQPFVNANHNFLAIPSPRMPKELCQNNGGIPQSHLA